MNQSTPLTTDIYSRFMAEAFKDRDIIGVPTGFQSFFGNPAGGSMTYFSPDAAVVEIDILRGNEKLAAMVTRGTGGRSISGQKNTNDQKYSSEARKFPLIEEEGDIGSNQLITRMAGENPYSRMTRFDRLRELALGHHREHLRRIVRTCEFLASSSILDGQMPGIIGTSNSNLIYDFHRKDTHNMSAAAAWDGEGSDIFGDLDAACDLVRQDGHVTPDMGIIGDTGMASFLNDSVIKEQADNRRYEIMMIDQKNPLPPRYQRFVDAGFIPRGWVRTPKGYELYLFTYVDTYQNSDGVATKYMPADVAIVTYSGIRCDRYFGPADMLPMDDARAAWFTNMFGFNPGIPQIPSNIKNVGHALPGAAVYCDAYIGENHKTITIRTQCAPIFATTMTDAIVKITGLVSEE